MVPAETLRCGMCPQFDCLTVDKKPVGTTRLPESDQQISLGFCRAPFGLTYGARMEIAACIHPEVKNRLLS